MERNPGVRYSAAQIRNAAAENYLRDIVAWQFYNGGVELDHMRDMAVVKRDLTDPKSGIGLSIKDLIILYKEATGIDDLHDLAKDIKTIADGIVAENRFSIALERKLKLRVRLRESARDAAHESHEGLGQE